MTFVKSLSEDQPVLWDAPDKDYRQRYELPDQFVWDIASQARIAWDGYMRAVLDLLPPPPTWVIDVGCGPGMGARLLLEHGYQVEGIDYNERAIGFAKLLVPDAQFMQADIRLLQQMPELHNRFDVAIHIEVLEHIPTEYHAEVLQGIYRVLRAQGTLILTVPSKAMPINKWHYKHFELNEIIQLLTINGFVVKQVLYQDHRSRLFSPIIWNLLSNKLYDLRFARFLLRNIYLRHFNITTDPQKAGRFILQVEKNK